MRFASFLILVVGAQFFQVGALQSASGAAQWPRLNPAKPPVFGQFNDNASSGAAAKSDLTLSVKPDQGELDIRFKGRRVLLYTFGTNQFKPYVRELYTLKGQNIIRDAPPDHLHHHGLMYAIRVNGINFWEEAGQPGVERPVKILSHRVSRRLDGLPQGAFTELLHWVAGKDKALPDTAAAALLVERRTLTLTVDEAKEELALEWQCQFEVGPGAPKVTLAGATYHGLGLRLPKEFDRVARHENSAKLPYPTSKGDVTPARWSCVTGVVEGQEIGIALFGSSTGQRGPGNFFTMLEPFAYLSVTEGLDKAPLEYSSGDKFSLRYLLIVKTSHPTPDFLDERHQLWEKSLESPK